jgi:4-alpha-glucanotransferase
LPEESVPNKPTLSPSRFPRSSGVLLHVSSLPSRFGIGDLGPTAQQWVDALGKAGQRWWQILPLGPGGQGLSPYASLSAAAGNPVMISPDLLVQDGLLSRAQARPPRTGFGGRDRLDFPAAARHKFALLENAWERFRRKPPRRLAADFSRFRARHQSWLDDFTLFMALRQRYQTPWSQWPKPLVERRPAALAEAHAELAADIDRQAFFQFLFFRQWAALRKHAAAAGVKIIGDVPIFVAEESADVWANPHLFLLDRHHRPRVVTGVPPDYFSRTGQRWGNPMYDWTAMVADNFQWWMQRFSALLEQVDVVRIDHFRGFAGCWHIPASAPDARTGRWVKSPGTKLFKKLAAHVGGLPFIAEDLGVITPDVEALRDGCNLPGMRVLQFAFDGEASNPFLPHNYVRNTIAYTGTHDNDTTAGWYRSLGAEQRRRLARYAPDAPADPAWALIRLAWSSIADVAIAPLQDILNLGTAARMNTPGTTDGNWGWRLEDLKQIRGPLHRLATLTQLYARTNRH